MTWRYRCDLFGPSGNVTRNLPGAAVVHGRYSVDPARPWWGVSPLGWARLTGKLHANLEDAIADEASGTRGHVLPVPQGPDTDDDTDPLADLRADIASLRGKTVLAETTSAGWGEGQMAAPAADWRPVRLGFNAPASMATLRTDSAQAVLAACGCSADLFAAGDAAGQRESWRRFLHGAVQPLADLLAAELAVKLDVPGLRLTFDRLFASDLSGRARACAGVRQLGAGGHGRGPGGAARGSVVTPARPFLVLPVGYSLADVKWLLTDPEAEVDRMLEVDGPRRRWLSPPAEVVERYAAEVEDEASDARRAGRLRAEVTAAEKRAGLRG